MHTCAPPSLMDGQQASCPSRRIGVLFPPADSNPQHMCAHAHTHLHKHKCAHMLRCAYTHTKAHTHIHMHTNTHTCKHTCRHSRTAVSAPWQKLQGCIPLPPARILHRLRAEEGPWGGRHTGGGAAGWRFWKSGLWWVWDQALRQREWRRCWVGRLAESHKEHQLRKNQGQFLMNLLEGELYVGSLNKWLVS